MEDKTPQQLFDELREKRSLLRSKRQEFKDNCIAIPRFAELNEQGKAIRQEQNVIKVEVASEYHELDESILLLKGEVETLEETLNMKVLNTYLEKKNVEITDQKGNKLTPVVSVKLKQLSLF